MFANIWEHTFPESLVAEGLVERGATVTTVRCGTMLQSHCVAMSAAGVGPDAPLNVRERVCVACTKRRDLVDSTIPFEPVVLDTIVTAQDRKAASRTQRTVTLENWVDYELDGVALGRYAAYEFLLNNKILGTDIPEPLWPRYLNKLEQSVLVYLSGKRLMEIERPDRVIVYNRLYAVNHAFCEAAKSLGIPTYTLQGGGHIVHRGESLTMFRDTQSLHDVYGTKAWHDYRDAAIGDSEVNLVGTHLSGLLEGSSAFAYSSAFQASQPGDLRQRFGVPDGARVLLVPMSSEDEVNAARLADVLPEPSDAKSLFSDQFEWLVFLFEYAAAHPELHIIVRLHPRMFPNKRENVLSPIVTHILDLLERAPSNVATNLPTDDVSMYDLMQIVDVLLNFRSSAGAELAAFGVPVVTPANRDFYSYPPELNLIGATRDQYARQIDAALAAGWSIDNARRAFRWFAFLFTRVAVDLSGSVRSRPIAIRPKKPGLRLRLWRFAVWIVVQYGPLVRERNALRNRSIEPSSRDIFYDVLESDRGSLAESPIWPSTASTVTEETAALESYLRELCSSEWKEISDPRSLAGRVRSHLRIS